MSYVTGLVISLHRNWTPGDYRASIKTFRFKLSLGYRAGKKGPFTRMPMQYGEILKMGGGPHTKGPALKAMTPPEMKSWLRHCSKFYFYFCVRIKHACNGIQFVIYAVDVEVIGLLLCLSLLPKIYLISTALHASPLRPDVCEIWWSRLIRVQPWDNAYNT